MMTAHRKATLAAVSGTLATWFLIGYQSEGGGSDHLVKLPQLDRRVGIAVGFGFLVLAAWALDSLWQADRVWMLSGWRSVYARLFFAGVVAVGEIRIITAGGHGANIGGGMLLMVGLVPVLFLIEGARRGSVCLRRDESVKSPRVAEFSFFSAIVLWIALYVAASRCGVC